MKTWEIVNRRLIAKALAELSYEQILNPKRLSEGTYRVELSHGVNYEFTAWQTIWDYLRIDVESIVRNPALPELRADQFYLDTKVQHGMSDITLANFLEELYRTQWSDLKTIERQESHKDQDLLALEDDVLQTLLDGHPKALVNKGRIGWSQSDLQNFAPESAEPFQLHWLAVRNDSVLEEFAKGFDSIARLHSTMSRGEAENLQKRLLDLGLDQNNYALIPCHPWQWNEVIIFHYQNEIQNQSLVSLGVFGDFYRPQTSLRTLSNVTNPRHLQIKLPVSILNTSCVRGIDGKYIPISPRLTEVIRGIAKADPQLQNLVVLGDVSGAFVTHPQYSQIEEAPYRFKEFLGCIWRDSPQSLLDSGEKCILTATLFHKPANQRALITQIIERSGLTTEAWLAAYFETVLIPLYHLQLKHGIGLVAHGQNIMLALKDFKPSKLVIKDFQGDLRLLDKDIPELDVFSKDLKSLLTRLPAAYLIHDLLTGHMVTVLRFVSAVLKEEQNFPEEEFYSILRKTLLDYHNSVPEYEGRLDSLGMLAPSIPRVLVNKVRFHIGYGDSALRPLPMVGTDLINPLYEARHV